MHRTRLRSGDVFSLPEPSHRTEESHRHQSSLFSFSSRRLLLLAVVAVYQIQVHPVSPVPALSEHQALQEAQLPEAAVSLAAALLPPEAASG